jgi:hypothetical protein
LRPGHQGSPVKVQAMYRLREVTFPPKQVQV